MEKNDEKTDEKTDAVDVKTAKRAKSKAAERAKAVREYRKNIAEDWHRGPFCDPAAVKRAWLMTERDFYDFVWRHWMDHCVSIEVRSSGRRTTCVGRIVISPPVYRHTYVRRSRQVNLTDMRVLVSIPPSTRYIDEKTPAAEVFAFKPGRGRPSALRRRPLRASTTAMGFVIQPTPQPSVKIAAETSANSSSSANSSVNSSVKSSVKSSVNKATKPTNRTDEAKSKSKAIPIGKKRKYEDLVRDKHANRILKAVNSNPAWTEFACTWSAPSICLANLFANFLPTDPPRFFMRVTDDLTVSCPNFKTLRPWLHTVAALPHEVITIVADHVCSKQCLEHDQSVFDFKSVLNQHMQRVHQRARMAYFYLRMTDGYRSPMYASKQSCKDSLDAEIRILNSLNDPVPAVKIRSALQRQMLTGSETKESKESNAQYDYCHATDRVRKVTLNPCSVVYTHVVIPAPIRRSHAKYPFTNLKSVEKSLKRSGLLEKAIHARMIALAVA